MDIERDSGLVKNRLTAWAGWLGVASCAVMAVKCLPFVTALCRRELQGVTCNDSQVFMMESIGYLLLGWGFVLIARRGLGIADARMCIPFRVKVMVAFTISVVVFTLSRLPVNRQTPPDYVNTGDVRQNEVDACDAESGQP